MTPGRFTARGLVFLFNGNSVPMKKVNDSGSIDNLVVVFGDQLSCRNAVFQKIDKNRDAVWMAEVDAEAEFVWSHKARIAVFLSAMRHFRDKLLEKGYRVFYTEIEDEENHGNLENELLAALRRLKPDKVVCSQPGEWRIQRLLESACKQTRIPYEIRPDSHFLCSLEEFEHHCEDRKELRMEYFYREMRKRTGLLMKDEKPVGGEWNYDKQNRESFGSEGPQDLPLPLSFEPDKITDEVIQIVKRRFRDYPGSLKNFDWPVSRKQAQKALRDFLRNRLRLFGDYQDAMWTDEPFLYHSLLSSSLNLKLLDSLEVVQSAEEEYSKGRAGITAVEGFIRQIIGWREYVRGVYWRFMPDYIDGNALEADFSLPAFYWTANTDMRCLHEVIQQTLEYSYAHHIQRLMVTGLFALLLGVSPREVHKWYLAIYVDAVEWVELPNTLGMSQYADGGIMASKPYAASGKYIQRMSNYCRQCRYEPSKRAGERACPYSTLYWDFLARNEKRLSENRRMTLQLKNLQNLDRIELKDIRKEADRIRSQLT